MSEPAFTCTDPSTWPVLLTVDEVAAIVRRKVGGLRKAVQLRTFVPAPMTDSTGQLVRPWRWRKADVERYVIGARGAWRRTG